MTNTMNRTNFLTKTVTKVRTFLSGMFMEVYADAEPNPTNVTPEPQGQPTGTQVTPPASPTPTGTVPFEQLIANARREEKDKLYPQIEEWKKKSNDFLLVIAEKDKEIAELTTKVTTLEKENTTLKDSSTKGTANNVKVAELSAQLATAQNQLAELQVKYDTDVTSLKAESYRKEKIAEAQGNIIPELVTGNTPEEIDASYEKAVTRYNEITQKVVGNVQVPTAFPQAGVMQDSLGSIPITDVRNMSNEEYAKHRASLGMPPIGRF